MIILTLKKINFIIKNEIEIFETLFRNNFYSKIPLIQEINNYFFKIKGKYIRPIFVFLITKMLGNISKTTYDLAILIELIHTASLIHDDVIDFSNTRRGFLSINAIWQNKTAVIFGDYIFSKSLNIAIKNNHIDYLNLISKTIEQMSEGEILQMKYFNKFFIKEYIYNLIILKKTAILISACCEGCAKYLNKKKKIVLNIKQFGELAGIAFQIKDDLLEYKNNINDNENYFLLLREFKITLPFIYALKKTSKKYKNWLFNEFNNKNLKKYSLIKILNFIQNSGGIEYSIYKIKLFTNKALLLLNNYPNNKANKSLKYLILFNKERLF